ncbi:S9 family peptidase [Cyclobacterium plantarum]|uniref:Acyl-peptide hydrolase n=1 Tax=Cyclobacterium plantarum TaxID=2716263 RepID=A0ABX0HFV9_9BACT|nr:prolyl oligopeptidase family serine peptidase [Cyclobacterium plantarum]NHE59224.1 prolyl oligopeptidase family serine peptidase [Cyclobacterium plantarum]
MLKRKFFPSFALLICLLLPLSPGFAQDFSTLDVSKFSFPSGLTANATQSSIAWAMNEQGRRNVYFAEAPDYQPERITDFMEDDGQEISSLQFSEDGEYLVFVRGGDHGGGNASRPVNTNNMPLMTNVAIWTIELATGKTEMLTEGDDPVWGTGHQLAFNKNGAIWWKDLDAEEAPHAIIQNRGSLGELRYSPDGKQLAFVANRGTHSLIGIYTDAQTPVKWLAPSFQRDQSPRWSPDGKSIAFVRTLGGSGAALPLLEKHHAPWEIWTADVVSGKAAMQWKAPETLRGSIPSTQGGFNLHWPVQEQLVYLSYEDGWPHLYSRDLRNNTSTLLTPGDFMVEQLSLHPDGQSLVFAANGGDLPDDLDRRHLATVDLTTGKFAWKTSGEGIEAYPVFTGREDEIAYFSATPKRPLLPAILREETVKLLGEELIPDDFPEAELISPKHVQFTAADGTTVYGQLFEPPANRSTKPAVVFVHGGPQRQMLLGWSYMDYYSNTYAINQKLVEMGFVVLSVNYRLGIGYGYEFHRPSGTYYQGAAEYQDIKAAGEYLSGLDLVDPERIGIYGGSYGGYLTAMALARDSGLFKVGVDISGVHDMDHRYELPEGIEVAPDYAEAKQIAWESSPIADLDQWTSPVLFIHSDDDRNVGFYHSADLARRFDELGKPYDYLVIPGDTHHWMKFSNMVQVNEATVNFLHKHLQP